MTGSNSPRVEAVTAARWWGQQLRDLAATLKPIATVSEADFVGQPVEKMEALILKVRHRMTTDLYSALTEEKIGRFVSQLAEYIEAEMEAHPHSRCVVTQWDKYHTSAELAAALRDAGIPTEMYSLTPVFDTSMSTVSEPGEVSASGDYLGKSLEYRHIPLAEV